jgi:predicted small lipoprotein YifL
VEAGPLNWEEISQMKKVLAGLCAGVFALALVGCGESAPVKKPDKTKKTETATKCEKCGKTPCVCEKVDPKKGD